MSVTAPKKERSALPAIKTKNGGKKWKKLKIGSKLGDILDCNQLCPGYPYACLECANEK